MTRLRVIGVLALLPLAVACGDEVNKSPGAKPPATKTAAAQADAGVAADAGPPLPKLEVKEGDFSESDKSRDPFRAYGEMLAEEAKGQAVSQRKVIFDKFSIEELKLVGIVTRIHPAKAMLVDPTGQGKVVKSGDAVGRAELVQPSGPGGAAYEVNWRVDAVRDGDIVLVRADRENPDVPVATRVIPLRPEGTVVASE
jgi:type IV pilus assembly protein PilP